MPKDTKEEDSSSDGLLESMKFRLRDEFAVPEKELSRINSVEGAKYLVGYFTSKNSKDETTPDEKEEPRINNKLPPGLGIPDLDPPDDSQLVKNLNETSQDIFLNVIKPARINNALRANARWNSDARILMVFDSEYPEGRIF